MIEGITSAAGEFLKVVLQIAVSELIRSGNCVSLVWPTADRQWNFPRSQTINRTSAFTLKKERQLSRVEGPTWPSRDATREENMMAWIYFAFETSQMNLCRVLKTMSFYQRHRSKRVSTFWWWFSSYVTMSRLTRIEEDRSRITEEDVVIRLPWTRLVGLFVGLSARPLVSDLITCYWAPHGSSEWAWSFHISLVRW